MNTILTIGAGSFVTYLVGTILNPEKIFQYTTIAVIIGVITYILYNKTDNKLKSISTEIGNLTR